MDSGSHLCRLLGTEGIAIVGLHTEFSDEVDPEELVENIK